MKRSAIATFLVVFLACASAAQSSRGPSTKAERDRIVKLAAQLQANPLDPELTQERAWAMKWIADVPDITVNLCEAVFKPMMDSRQRDVLAQVFTVEAAAYIIEHPDKAELDVEVNLAGMQAMLKAYQAIVAKSPRQRTQELDDLLDTRDEGGLEKYVSEQTLKCSNNPKS